MQKFEEKYNDPLRSIEMALVTTYRKHDKMTDWETLQAINAAMRVYKAEQNKRKPPVLQMTPLIQQSYDALKVACDGWLGRVPVFDETGQMAEIGDNALTLQEVLDCLKRIQRSVEMWQKEGGRRGYFNFINQFLP